MRINELQEGDVLFTMLGQKSPALHTQIYTGDTHFEHTLIHAVDDPSRGGPSKLMATGLKTDGMLVYRSKNEHLGYEAYMAAIRWIKYLVPYDQDRKTLKEGFRNTIPDKTNLVALMRTLFYDHGVFRAIKYTARRNEILCYPTDGESSRGLTCTMFVILCYQAGGLSEHVATGSEMAVGETMVRISDKKMTHEDLNELDKLVKTGKVDAADATYYKEYVGRLQSGNEYKIKWEESGREAPTRVPNPRVKGYQYFPSILCWKNPAAIKTFDFASAITTGFMVDAKITTSEQLRLCLDADKVGWKEMGYLDGSEKAPSDPRYKEKLTDYSKWATSSRNAFLPEK